tara:strand:+ start:794 stop:1060 length:267 start_codon:yes stop_codon:yes gene_type:complete
MYIYILSALAISLMFFIYNYVFYLSTKKPEEKDIFVKEKIKDSFVIFVLSSGIYYLIQEYFHNDFVSKIFPKPNTKNATEIFTDQPGF